ncbi:cytidine deaminase [Clostridiales bacterium COT073_COT-073]|nr:cytidine deaminase [Clostridiales bacterium COT073_COT-073]
MNPIWIKLYEVAKSVQNSREVSEKVSAGGVAAAIETVDGNVYKGVCIDTSCTLGICAERNAIFNMITNGENRIKRIIAIRSNGSVIAPCGACRELIAQLMPGMYQDVEVMMDFEKGKVVTLGELTPMWWL